MIAHSMHVFTSYEEQCIQAVQGYNVFIAFLQDLYVLQPWQQALHVYAWSRSHVLPCVSRCVQSAQRSKARKLRHIMQLEEEVATLEGISAQQQATISGLQQEASLLSTPLHILGLNPVGLTLVEAMCMWV